MSTNVIDTDDISYADTTRAIAVGPKYKNAKRHLVTSIPAQIVKRLKIDPRDGIQWLVMRDGTITIKKVQPHVRSETIEG